MIYIARQIFRSLNKSTISITTTSFPYTKSRSFSQNPAAQRNLIPLSNIFRRYGFLPAKLPNFFKKNDFLLQLNPSEIEKYFESLLSLKPSRDFLVSTISSCPRVLEHGFLEKWQSGIADFRIQEISSEALGNILEVAMKFDLNPNDVSSRLKSLKGLGFSERTISRVLEAIPTVIKLDEGEIQSKVEFLMGIGFLKREIDKIFNLFPGIFAFEVEKRLKPLVDEFVDLGFSLSEVRREVLRDPVALSSENGELSHCLEMLTTLKCRVKIKEEIFWHGEFRAAYKAKLRVDCLRKHGLTYRDSFTVLWKEPRIMLYEIEDIEKKINFLKHMKFDVYCLVEVPEYLGVSFEKQIVPRCKVIEYLRSNGGLGDEVSLKKLIKLSRLRFYNMYVKPYPECAKMYGRLNEDVKVKIRHPVGMWKLFRPQQYSESRADVKNMKSYVDSLP